ncbi:hypothetical protein TRFO_31677 [Tritrichomonas foetus]|uniref:Uncharacterized protein n=1 Tax=Tritrichomonas foetus TaxID=1144522 RepID=A0A1J4JQU5_9EUKA|nr:hypothetical protein TRFO_31677 [Tritrichomonas foetus]|eukprot:OHT01489.1 hypothetical protein TRFO_31677 [Tritrichomonas foetus]
MENVLSSITKLVETKRITNPEEAIMTQLIDLDPFLDITLDDSQISQIEHIIHSLFTINNGVFSIQCAIYISSRLLKLYLKSKTPKLWDMINFSIQNSYSTTIIATGYLCRHLGESNRAQLPRFIDHILKNCSKYQFASIYALRAIFKVGRKAVSQFANQAFDFTNRIIGNTKQHTIMMALKFLRVLVRTDTIPLNIILETAKNILLKDSELPFIQNEVAILVARCAYRPYEISLAEKSKENSEWAVLSRRSNNQVYDFTPSLTTINQFPTIAAQSFTHFISLLGTEVTSFNHVQLFKYVRSFIPQEITRLIPLLPGDSRFTYFREISKESISAQQVKLLKILCPDDNCIKDTANLAQSLANSPDKASRKQAIEFFASLAKSHPFLVSKYISSSLSNLKKLLTTKGENDPTTNEKNNNAIFGNSSVISAILGNLSITEKESAVHDNKSALESLIKTSLANVINPNMPIYAAIFEILQTLPKQYAALSVVSKAIDTIMQLKQPNKKLLKSVFAFRAKFSKPSQNSKLVEYALKITHIPLPISVLTNLCSMIPKIKASPEVAYKTTIIILKRAMNILPSQSLTKSFIKHPLPLASELLDVKKQTLKTDAFLNQVIRKFPLLLTAVQPDNQKFLMSTVLEPKNQNMTTLLILASMCEARITRNLVPLNLHKYLLSLLTAKNTNLFQSICECIALFARSHPEVLPDLFDFIEAQKNVNGSLLTSSIFAHVTVPKQYLVRAINYLDEQLKSHGNIAFTVHALHSVILTHSMQISAVGNSANQFPHLFNTMQNASSLQPVTLQIIGDCFRSLIETFSSDLVTLDSPISKTVIISLRTIAFTPMSYAKEVYFNCSRSIYTFAHILTNYAPIVFPTSIGASVNGQLAACEAYSDYMKFESMSFDVPNIVPLLLSILQTTGDIRAHHFIVSIASMMNEENVSFWVSTVRRVLVTSSLIDSTSLAIEPTHEVKRACVDISMYIVDIISNAFILSTENLDDIVSALCRANETGSVQLQEAAFPVLQKVIESFKDKVTEDGGRLLDLYDSQFASVVKVGFQLNLSISGGFLSTYLTFNTDNMSKDPENCSAILIVYLNGLDSCQQRSTPFYSLATHLCTVGRKFPQIRSLIQPFLITLTPIFSGIVLQAMSLWNSRDDWRAMNEFRSLAAPFYHELLPAFVWLQTISNQIVIEVNVLVAFFVIEMKFGREAWQKSAAFEALSTALDFCGSNIPSNLLELSIKTALDFSNVDERLFLTNSAALLKGDSEWDAVRKCLLSLCTSKDNAFSVKTFAYLLSSDTERASLRPYALFMATFIIQKFKEQKITFDSTNALFILLFKHSPNVIAQVCDFVIATKGLSAQFKLMVIDLSLTMIKEGDSFGSIPRYLLSSFRKGGMHLLGHYLITKPNVGIALLSKGAAKAAFLLALKDIENSRAFLWFLQLSMITLEKHSPNPNTPKLFACSIFRLCIKMIDICGKDPLNGRMTVWHCIRMIQDAQRIAGSKILSYVYNEIDQDQKSKLAELLNQSIYNELQNKKMQELMEFSTNDRGKRNDEWQTLEIDDSD